MSKHAYLIMEHGNLPVAQAALRLIDDPRNDVFIYIDGDQVHESDFVAKQSKIYFLHKHVTFGWGDFLPVEMELIKFATSTGKYGYYHLLSDCCLPIKTQDQIHDFFDNDPNQMIYMHLNCHTFKSIQRECMTHYPFVHRKDFRKTEGSKASRSRSLFESKSPSGLTDSGITKEIPVVYNGWQWWSIPDDFARYIVEKEICSTTPSMMS
jgi:hypothetical protein